MSQTTPTGAPAPTLIEVAKTVFGKYPEDVVLVVEIGQKTLNWLHALFGAIEHLHQESPRSPDIKHLIGLGEYVSADFANLLDCEREQMMNCIKMAEASTKEARL